MKNLKTKKMKDVLELQKMDISRLISYTSEIGVDLGACEWKGRQGLIYAILDKQNEKLEVEAVSGRE